MTDLTTPTGLRTHRVLDEQHISFATNGFEIARSLNDLRYMRNLIALRGPLSEAGNIVNRDQVEFLISALHAHIQRQAKARGLVRQQQAGGAA